jgi:hypothetical protein
VSLKLVDPIDPPDFSEESEKPSGMPVHDLLELFRFHGVDSPAKTTQSERMDDPVTPRELDAKLENVQLRMDKRVEEIASKIDASIVEGRERDKRMEMMFSLLKDSHVETRGEYRSVKQWIVATAVGLFLGLGGIMIASIALEESHIANITAASDHGAALEKRFNAVEASVTEVANRPAPTSVPAPSSGAPGTKKTP